MSVNNKEIPILVIYYTKEKIICQKEFGSFSNFGTLLEYFNRNVKTDKYQLKKKYLLNSNEIKESDLLINLIQEYDKSKIIAKAKISLEIEESNNIGDENLPFYKKILEPIRGDFGLYVFTAELGTISLEKYIKDIEIEYGLQKFNLSSAYCNSPNALYMSGGIFDGEKLTNFWIIDNENYSIQTNDMLFPKANHSMIYINNNDKEIIFLAGGDDLKTFYFDIKNNNFVNWGNMTSLCSNPALLNINNYLYCFYLVKDENSQLFFERTNLDEQNHIWERIYPNFAAEQIKNMIMNCEFGVCRCAKGQIVLWGGNFNNPNSYLYDLNDNLLSFNEKNNNQFVPLFDKTFYKINSTHNIALPCNINRHVGIYVLNKLKKTLRYIHFNPNEQNKKFNFKNIHKQSQSIGKIIVEFKTVNSERIETNENDNNSIPINDNIFSEKKIPAITYEKNPQYSEKEKLDVQNNKIISESNNNNNNLQNELNYNSIQFVLNNHKNNKNNHEINQSNNMTDSQNMINNNISNKRKINVNLDKGIETDDNIIDNQDDVFELENNTKKKKKIINEEDSQNNIEKNNYINENGNMVNNSSEINNILSDNNIHIDSDNNIISDNDKNIDYNEGIHNESKKKMNYGEEEFEEPKEDFDDNINEQNNYDENQMEQNEENNNENYYESNEDGEHYEYNEMNGEEHLNQFNEEGNLYEEGENQEMNGEDNEEEDEELLERDRFEQTIIQPIGEDIIQIESYPIYFYEENNFCDYEYSPEEID